jgi:hypothetical protein
MPNARGFAAGPPIDGRAWRCSLGPPDLSLMKKSSAAINIHEAKTHLSKLVDRAAKAEAFVIPKR